MKTTGGWSCAVLDAGVVVWTSRFGQQCLRDAHGTLDVSPDRQPGAVERRRLARLTCAHSPDS